MPDVHLVRHGDRWAVKESADATPHFESYTREEAEAEARRIAAGGTVHVAGDDDGELGVGQVRDRDAAGPADTSPEGSAARPGEAFRDNQAGL